MLCFSAGWHNPVVWAHYSDGQKGLCLGFEVPEIKGDPESDESMLVDYIAEPLQFPPDFSNLPDTERMAIVQKILRTKFDSWEYEKEIRVWAPLQNEEGGLYFLDFDEKLRLVEVIVGARCTLPRAAVVSALGPLESHVSVINARAAYCSFQMVEDEQWI